MTKFKIDDKVWFRGQFTENFSLRGKIEYISHGITTSYGVRLENGNFHYVDKAQLKTREN